MPNQTAAMLVIGDEILSGRTRDANMPYLAEALTEKGIPLVEMRVVADDPDAIISAVQDLSKSADLVFTSGGIGPTHDDITADCVAAAFDTPISVRADALAILQAFYDERGIGINDARRRMARIPDGATLIDNPVSSAPGFRIGNVHVMAGVPKIFQAMVQSVLPGLSGGAPLISKTLRVLKQEGEIAGPLRKVATANPDVSIGSYPFYTDGVYGAQLVVRGADAATVERVHQALIAVFEGHVQ